MIEGHADSTPNLGTIVEVLFFKSPKYLFVTSGTDEFISDEKEITANFSIFFFKFLLQFYTKHFFTIV